MNNKELNHNASDKLSEPLTALVKTRTFALVQSKSVNKLSTST